MVKKQCPVCSFSIKESWNFCPNCGAALSRDFENSINLKVPIEVFQNLTPIVNNLVNSLIQAQGRKEQVNEAEVYKPAWNMNTGQVVEPQDYVTRYGDAVIHTVYMPGVRDRSDIAVNKFENSIEIRARTDDKFYLKIIKREKNEVVASEEFSKDNFILKLKKKNKRSF